MRARKRRPGAGAQPPPPLVVAGDRFGSNCSADLPDSREMQQEGEKAGRFGDCSESVIGACIEVHRWLGPGLLESAYEHCLAHELGLRGVRIERQLELPVTYKTVELRSRLSSPLSQRSSDLNSTSRRARGR
jgi:hypothetical protein